MATVLVIEDDGATRRSIQRLLQAAGFEVTAAADGGEGMALFREQAIDVVVTDIIMPEQEGIETIMRIRSIAPFCPIVAISGGGRIGNADFLQMAERAGASAVLAKPFEPGQLIAIVREVLAAEAERLRQNSTA